MSKSVVESLPPKITPDDIRRTLGVLTKKNMMVVIFDEFDRLSDQTTKALVADTIKTLSDYAVDATIILIGVADSVDQLIHEHHSVERALVQVHLPRMSDEEIKEIITKGLLRLTLKISHDAMSATAAGSKHQQHPYSTGNPRKFARK